MNWEAIGAIGEILGALAVVITLVYLALQVRHAKATAADANRLARASGTHTAALTTAMDGEVQQAVIKSIGARRYYQDFAEKFDLDFDEAARADIWNVSWFWLHWGQYRSIKEPEDLEELKHIVKSFYSIPSILYSWNHSPFGKTLMEFQFVNFVEECISQTKS